MMMGQNLDLVELLCLCWRLFRLLSVLKVSFWWVLQPKVQDDLGIGRSPAVSGALGSSWSSGKNGIKLFIEALELCKNGMISVTVTLLLLQLLSTSVVLGAPFPCWKSSFAGIMCCPFGSC